MHVQIAPGAEVETAVIEPCPEPVPTFSWYLAGCEDTEAQGHVIGNVADPVERVAQESATHSIVDQQVSVVALESATEEILLYIHYPII